MTATTAAPLAEVKILQSMLVFTDLDPGLTHDPLAEVRRLHRMLPGRVQGPLPAASAARIANAATSPARPDHTSGLYHGHVLHGPEKKQHRARNRVPVKIDIDSGSELNVLGPEDYDRIKAQSSLKDRALGLHELERPIRVVAANRQAFAEDAQHGCHLDIHLGDGQIARQVLFVILPGFSAQESFNSDVVLGKPFLDAHQVVVSHDSDPSQRSLFIRRPRLHQDTLYSEVHGEVEVIKCTDRQRFRALMRERGAAAFVMHGDHQRDDPVLHRLDGAYQLAGPDALHARAVRDHRERAQLRRLRALVAKRRPQSTEDAAVDDGKPLATGDWFADPKVQKTMENTFKNEYSDLDGETGDPVPEKLLNRRPAMTLDLISADVQPATATCRRPTQAEGEIARAKLADLIGRRVIRPCESQWSACVLWIPKGPGQPPRLVVDWRGLNEKLRNDEHPLPLIDEIIDAVITGGAIKSSTDLFSGYDHLPLLEAHQHRAAFILLGGLWCPTRAGQGIKTSPAKFTRWVMSEFREEIDGVWRNLDPDGNEVPTGHPAGKMTCVKPGYMRIFIDDVIIWANDERTHAARLHHTFQKMRKLGIRVKMKKTALWKREIKFLGFRLGDGTKSADPEMVSAILDSAVPTTRKRLKSFLGAASFFRSFIHGYASLAYPLETITTKDHPGQTLLWTSIQQEAYEEILRRLASLPSLRAPRWTDPYVVQCDASDLAMGGALLQKQADGELYPVAFWSQRLSPAEISYGVHEKESLAVKVSCLKYQHYLLNRQTHRVEVDNAATVHLFRKTANKLSEREQRLVHQLAPFALDIVHVTGTIKNPAADWLSRRMGKPALLRKRIRVIEFCSGTGSLLYGILAARDSLPENVTIDYTAVDHDRAAQEATRKAYLHCQATAPGLFVRPVKNIYFTRPHAGKNIHDLVELLDLWQEHPYKVPTKVDLVVATPSCQPYSRAVRHKLAEGLGDKRDLFRTVVPLMSLIKAKSPAADILCENVPFGISREDTDRKPHQPWGDWNTHLREHLEIIDAALEEIDGDVRRHFHPMRFYGPTTRTRMVWTTIDFPGRDAVPADRLNWQSCLPDDCTAPSTEAPAMVASKNSHSDRSGAASVYTADGTARDLTHEERECVMGLPRNATQFPGASDAQRHRLVGNSVPVYFWEALLRHWFTTLSQATPPGPEPTSPAALDGDGQEEDPSSSRPTRTTGIRRIIARSSHETFRAALRSVRVLDETDLAVEDGELPRSSRIGDVAVQVLMALSTEPTTPLPPSAAAAYGQLKEDVKTCVTDLQYQRWYHAASSSAGHLFFDVLDDGLLYRVTRYGGRRRALVIPASQKELVHRAVHLVHTHADLGGHASRRKTLALLKQYFFFERMATVVDEFCKHCEHCQLHRARSQRAAPDLHMIPAPPWPGYRLHTDIVLGLPEDNDTKATAVWVWQCAFSRKSVYIPIRKNHNTMDLLHFFLERVIGTYGIPHEIVGDRDGRWARNETVRSEEAVAVVTDAMTTLSRISTAMFGLTWNFAAVGNHRSNGRAEVQIKTVTAALAKYGETFSGDPNWTRRLAMLELAYNNQAHSSMDGLSPNQVFMGRQLPGPLDEPGDPEVGSHRYFAETFRETLLASWEKVNATVAAINDQIEERYRSSYRTAPPRFRRNQLVKVPVLDQRHRRHGERKTKLSPRWEGPYRVVGADEFNVVIDWSIRTKRSPKFPIADVLPWYDVNATDQFPVLALKPPRPVPPEVLPGDGSATRTVQVENITVPDQFFASRTPRPDAVPAADQDLLLGFAHDASAEDQDQALDYNVQSTSPQ